MTIVKAKSFIEAYKLKAKSEDINELSGRSGRPELTQFVSKEIIKQLEIKITDTIIDVGCGDGSVLIALENFFPRNIFDGRLIGILPTTEEVSRLNAHLLQQEIATKISIEYGRTQNINLANNSVDILICNGVLLILDNLEDVYNSLNEFKRVSKLGATIYIGEMPDVNEFFDRDYGDSISKWLFWVLRKNGFKSFLTQLKKTIFAFFNSEPFIIFPKKILFIKPEDFIRDLKKYNLDVVSYFRHKELDATGKIIESKTRYNYIAIKR